MRSASVSALLVTSSLFLTSAGTAPLVHLSQPEVWSHLDANRLMGRPAQLAWSDSEDALYLQTVDGTIAGALTVRHYLVRKGEEPNPVEKEPPWAEAYWKWKSAKTYFGDPLMRIDVDSHRETLDPIRDRNTAYLNSDSYAPATLEGKATAGSIVVNRLMLKGQVIGEFIDEQIFPGYTFSWSPDFLGMIAFRARSGRLTIMDVDGRTQTAEHGKDVWLPAWSPSGELIAYVERNGRKRLTVWVVSTL